MIKATTTIKYAKVAPKKAMLLANAIRHKSVSQSLWIIKSSALRCGEYFNHAITNTSAALKDKGSVTTDPFIIDVQINKGPVFKRFRSGSRGYGNKYTHKTSNITLTLSDNRRIINKTEKDSVKKPLLKDKE